MTESSQIVWIRRDLRLADNPALRDAAASGPVLCVFVHEPPPAAWADGVAARWWQQQSLGLFRQQLAALGGRLIERVGDPAIVLPALAAEIGAATVQWNRRYAPAQQAVDTAVERALRAAGLTVRSHAGGLLFEPWAVTRNGQPYQLFAAYWRACLERGAPAAPLPPPNRLTAPTVALADQPLPVVAPLHPDWETAWPPAGIGEAAAAGRLVDFLETAVARYGIARDLPDQPGTSRLSPHLAFGEITPRQIWHTVRQANSHGEAFLREVGWREFCWHTLHHAPHLPDQPLRSQFADFPWAGDEALFAAWSEGRTGYPIVDAGMRALAATGWMHNRVRMIVASFLVKDLLIPWQRGEAWFWQHLVDADLACNAGNWQWVAGCGLDAAPYFRIFNPVLQGEKFDARGRYVRDWVPELAGLPDLYIQRPATAPPDVLRRAGVRLGETYPQPIIDHGAARRRALAAYGQTRGAA